MEATVIAHRLTPNSITLNETIGDDEYVDMVAHDMIRAQDFTAANGAMIILRAGDNIVLEPGFRADSGSDAHVYISSECVLPPASRFAAQDANQLYSETARELNLDEPLNLTDLELFPNPASDEFQLRYFLASESPVSIQVFNNLGELIAVLERDAPKSAGINIQTVGVQNWAPGFYSVVILTDTQRLSKTFIVSH